MDGESRETSSDGARSQVMIDHLLFPTILTIAPIATWGIWILSESSFEHLSLQARSRQSVLRVMNRLSISQDIEDDRTSRKQTVQAIFLLCFFLFWTGYFIIFVVPNLALPIVTILFSLVLLGIHFMNGEKRREKIEMEKFDAELPTFMQLMTILISSGISPARAIDLLTRRPNSVSSRRLREVIDHVDQGESIVDALDGLATKHKSLILRRFTTGIVLGIERGSSLTPVLIAQVKDARNYRKNKILQKAGRAEISLMIPVVFLILPISIIFALWPSYQQLGSFI